MKACAALVVVVIGCKGNAPEAPPPPPQASSSASAAPAASVAVAKDDAAPDDAAPMDARSEEAPATTASHSPVPPLAKDAAWSVVRWNMASADVMSAFRDAGVVATPANDRKTGAERVSAKGNGWDATIYFGGGKPSQIVVTHAQLSSADARAIAAKVSERAAATTTTERTERRWRKGSAVSFVVTSGGSMREEWVRDRAPAGADVGLAKLTWGMTPAAAQAAFTTAGYTARIVKGGGGVDPCSLPNAPPSCAKKTAVPSIAVTKGDQEGTADFDDKGLAQVVLSGTTADKGAARLGAIEAALGKATSTETSEKTHHVDRSRATDIDVEVKELDGVFTVFETYRPSKA